MAGRVGPLLVIVGETASGKSALAMELAKRLDGEIISADSWTVYKGFDIGSAKPLPVDLKEVRHHLLDVADPVTGFNAVRFQDLTKAAIDDITSRGKLPILVGGTGLYIDSVIYDYGFLPPTDPAVRAELDDLSLEDLLERARHDGLNLSLVDARNKRRVIRLIENKGQLPTKQKLRGNTLILGIELDRNSLRERVESRVGAMISAGLESEVQRLAEQYGWDVEPMKGIGYIEWKNYLEGTQNLDYVRARIIKNTMDLAKRQRTWFKRNKSIHWIFNREDLQHIVDTITTSLNKV